jgi:hypothetical protein
MSRYLVAALALVVLLFAGGYALRGWLLPEPAVEPAPEPKPQPVSLTVSRVQGHVELREARASTWSPVSADARVSSDDALRTRDGAVAVLTGGDGLELEVSSESQLTVGTLARDNARVVLDSGRVAARVPKGAAELQVAVSGSDAVARTKDGTFAVLRDDAGQVSVAASAGEVELTAKQQRVQLHADEQSFVGLDRPPTPPSKVPSSLFLKVSHLGPAKLARKTTEFDGTVSPGAVVSINGAPVRADENGHFRAKIPLSEGANAIQVKARDASGRNAEQKLADVTVDTQAPKLHGKLVW